MTTCTLLLIHHTDATDASKGSLWIIDGDGRSDCSERKSTRWAKIIGPVYSNLEFETCDRLKKFFTNAGVQVFVEAIAD
jgi:hypothetical protein